MRPFRALQGFVQQARSLALLHGQLPVARGPGWAAVLVAPPYSYSGLVTVLQRTQGVRWGVLNHGRQGLWIIMARGEGALRQGQAELNQRWRRGAGNVAPLPVEPLRAGIPLSVVSTLLIYAGLSVTSRLVQGKAVLG